jgi:hypothetical protein
VIVVAVLERKRSSSPACARPESSTELTSPAADVIERGAEAITA